MDNHVFKKMNIKEEAAGIKYGLVSTKQRRHRCQTSTGIKYGLVSTKQRRHRCQTSAGIKYGAVSTKQRRHRCQTSAGIKYGAVSTIQRRHRCQTSKRCWISLVYKRNSIIRCWNFEIIIIFISISLWNLPFTAAKVLYLLNYIVNYNMLHNWLVLVQNIVFHTYIWQALLDWSRYTF